MSSTLQLFVSIELDASAERAIYLQISDGILSLIKNGRLQPGQRLPSVRSLSAAIGFNKITISRAFDELQMQGWVDTVTGNGTFVSSHIPEAAPLLLTQDKAELSQKTAGFSIAPRPYVDYQLSLPTTELHLDDGFPDPRLAPLKELYRAYRSQLTRSGLYQKFGSYGNPDGSGFYRQAISTYLNETRALMTTERNILSVRGTLMGINLVCNGLINPGDVVVSGVPGWHKAELNFIHAKADHVKISVDQHGLVVDELRDVCQKKKVRMVYVTPHHHYPTTVALRIDWRLELLRLANEYGFIIFEDDYDFDFHFKRRPLLPLASADQNGMVIYCGSFSKSFSPAFRMGYLAASENVIEHLSKVRILLDRQGDHILDNAMAEILNDGTITRYLRKTVPIYEHRRNLFCSLLASELNDVVNFTIPEGGMTVWTEFDASINLEALASAAQQKGLYLSNGRLHQYPGYQANGIRLGYASSTDSELEECVGILGRLVR